MVPGQIGMHTVHKARQGNAVGRPAAAGVSLIELLCVLAIITILASLMLPAIARAYSKVRGITQEWEADEVLSMLTTQTRRYCGAHPKYDFPTKAVFVQKCGFTPRPQNWVEASATEFVPFNFRDPTNEIVLTFHIGRNHATIYSLSKGELTITPPPR
jgi:prepilin-type N-terminal cleavage/methylation domain-containing protein